MDFAAFIHSHTAPSMTKLWTCAEALCWTSQRYICTLFISYFLVSLRENYSFYIYHPRKDYEKKPSPIGSELEREMCEHFMSWMDSFGGFSWERYKAHALLSTSFSGTQSGSHLHYWRNKLLNSNWRSIQNWIDLWSRILKIWIKLILKSSHQPNDSNQNQFEFISNAQYFLAWMGH